ncbi:MAG TPA: hypothetical protein VIV11_33745 [Kofleriaceae bacterium]
MSGELHAPLLAPDKAAKLLDDVLYERVLGCIDLEALFMIEVDLWVALSDCEGDDEATKHVAKDMIDRALRRLPDEERRYGMMRPFGMECPDCEDEMLETVQGKRGRKTD